MKNKEDIKEGFYSIEFIVQFSSIIIAILLLVSSNITAVSLFGGDINIARLVPLVVLFSCLNAIPLNYFRTFQQMKYYSAFLLLQTYLSLSVVSFIAIEGLGIYYAVLGLLASQIVLYLIMKLIITHQIGFKLPKFNNLKEYLSFGIPIIPSNLSSWVVESSDRYLISILLGVIFVGYYNPGYTLGNVILIFLAPFTLLLPSVLPAYYDKNEMEKVRIFLMYSLKYFLLIAIPSLFGLALLSKPILTILTTPEIAQNGYLITPFVALGALFFGIYGILSQFLILEKKTKLVGNLWIIAAVLNFGLNLALIPYFGMISAAIVTLSMYFLVFILTWVFSRQFEFKLDLGSISKSIFASIILSFFIYLINPEGILNVTITILVSAVIYLVILMLLEAIKKEEIAFLKNIMKT